MFSLTFRRGFLSFFFPGFLLIFFFSSFFASLLSLSASPVIFHVALSISLSLSFFRSGVLLIFFSISPLTFFISTLIFHVVLSISPFRVSLLFPWPVFHLHGSSSLFRISLTPPHLSCPFSSLLLFLVPIFFMLFPFLYHPLSVFFFILPKYFFFFFRFPCSSLSA